MSLEMTRRAWAVIEASDLRPAARITLQALADFANQKDGSACYPGLTKLRARTGLKATAQRRAVRELEAARVVSVAPRSRAEGRGRTSNLYTLHLPPTNPRNTSISQADQPSESARPMLVSRATNPRITRDQGSDSEGDVTSNRTREREPDREPIARSVSQSESFSQEGSKEEGSTDSHLHPADPESERGGADGTDAAADEPPAEDEAPKGAGEIREEIETWTTFLKDGGRNRQRYEFANGRLKVLRRELAEIEAADESAVAA